LLHCKRQLLTHPATQHFGRFRSEADIDALHRRDAAQTLRRAARANPRATQAARIDSAPALVSACRNAVEEIGSEIVREMRLACDKLKVNADLFCNESADIVDGKAFAQRRVKRRQATDGHDEAPDSVHARRSVQINAPVSVTLI
jgi:hypothetical protein